MEFRVLGPVECLVNGRRLPMGRPQERCVLAVLLLDIGRVVPVGRLVDLLWEGEPPRRARSIVHTHLSRLRHVLRQAVANDAGVRLITRGQGYMIEAPEDVVDAFQFRGLVDRAREIADPADRSAVLGEALALWRGPPLVDVATPRVREEICAGLEEQRLSAVEDRIDADLAAGRHHELVTELTNLAARYPLRERLVGQLMLARYRSGQQAQALAVYRETRARLVEELGIEPAVALRELEQSMLMQDPALVSDLTVDPYVSSVRLEPARATPAAAPGSWRGQRSHLTGIVGRHADSATLAALLRDHRLITVVGIGGVGKTTLALHTVEEAAPGLGRHVAVAALASVRGEDEVLLAIASLFGVAGGTVSEAGEGIEQVLSERPYLLVLDNCEHLATECARVARRLLSASPHLSILATSREPLGLPEETVWRLEPLAVPDEDTPPEATVPSLTLFLRRASEALPGFSATSADLVAIARICRRLDGLPLALELAASRLRALSPEQLAVQLEKGFGLLGRSRDGRGALDATLDWSYRMLSEPERTLFIRLSVFRAGFDATAAAQVCGTSPLTPDEVLPTLVSLVDRSLIQPFDVDGDRRYRLLEVVREYAAAQLVAAEPDAAVGDLHLDYWLETARAIAGRPYFHEQLAGWAAIVADLNNLRAAAEHGYASGRIPDVVELVTLLFDFWTVAAKYYAELDRWLERAAPHLPECAPEVSCLATFHRATLRGLQDDHVGAVALLRPALPDLAIHHPNDFLEGRTTEVRSLNRLLDPAALTLGAEVFDDARSAADPHHRLHGAAMYAETLITWGRYDEAARLCAADDSAWGTANPGDLVRYLGMRCLAALGLGDLDGAAAAEGLLREQLGRPENFLHAATSALPGALLALATNGVQASTVIGGVATALEHRYPPTMSRAYGYRILLAEAHRRAGQRDAAHADLSAALAQAVDRNDYSRSLPGVLTAALLAADLGDDAASRSLAGQWDRVRRHLGLPAPVGYADEVAKDLDLDPKPPSRPDPGYRWCETDLRGLVVSAYTWARRG